MIRTRILESVMLRQPAGRLGTIVALGLAAFVIPASAYAQAEAVEYYGLDALGSVRIIFDGNGNILGRMDYGPFGQEIMPSTAAQQNVYAGLFVDSEAGLDHAARRSFQERTGRFSSVDPIYDGLFEPQGWNRYTYSLNNPLTFTDPAGLNVISSSNPGCSTFPNDSYCSMEVWMAWWRYFGGDSGGGATGTNEDYGNVGSAGTGVPSNPEPPPNESPTSPNPPAGPPPGPPPPPPGPNPGDPFRCASARASSISLAYWAGAENSAVGQVLLGNDISAISDLAFGPDRSGALIDVILSNPSSRNVVSLGARVALLIPVTSERIHLAQNGAGNYYAQKVTGGVLGRTAAGTAIKGILGPFTIIKGGYDLGTYFGSLITCVAR